MLDGRGGGGGFADEVGGDFDASAPAPAPRRTVVGGGRDSDDDIPF